MGGCSLLGAHPHSCSQARLYGCCFGMVNMRRLAHPIITLSPSKPCTISQITSAESHPQETAVHQSLSYVFHILLWVTQIKSSEGTMPAQCASPKTQLFFVMIKNREKTPLKQTRQCSELQVETTDMSKLQPGRPKLCRHTPVNGQPGASCQQPEARLQN